VRIWIAPGDNELTKSTIFDHVKVENHSGEVIRNIVSLRKSEDLFDDLTSDPEGWKSAQVVETHTKPFSYRSVTPVIDRPFEDAEWFNAIGWPFKHWQASRFSDGSYGVWYGSRTIETTVYESAWHWFNGLLRDADLQADTIAIERKIYGVNCTAALLDFRKAAGAFPAVLDPADYTYAQLIGRRIHDEGHPGLIVQSVRQRNGENLAVFNPAVLRDPRQLCFLTYRTEKGAIIVEREPGVAWLQLTF
jgi:RES domain